MNLKRHFFGFYSLLTITGCTHGPFISISPQNQSAQDQTLCQGRICPELTISYPNFVTRDTALTARLETTRDSLILEALYLGSDQVNYSLSIGQSIDQYLWVALDYNPEPQREGNYNGHLNVVALNQKDTLLAMTLEGSLYLPDGRKTLNNQKRIPLKQ